MYHHGYKVMLGLATIATCMTPAATNLAYGAENNMAMLVNNQNGKLAVSCYGGLPCAKDTVDLIITIRNEKVTVANVHWDGTVDIVTDFSAVYDFDYYVAHYEDVKKAYANDKVGALNHFLNVGMKEGRKAKETFDVEVYKYNYKDLQEKYKDQLPLYYIQYILEGKSEGRNAADIIRIGTTVYNNVDYASVYNFEFYISTYPELLATYGLDDEKIIAQFVTEGMAEGNQASEDFNVLIYKNNYTDLQNAFGTDLKAYYSHFMNYGVKEGRNAVSFLYIDKQTGTPENPTHLTVYNGVDYAAVYDYDYYQKKNTDIIAACGTNDTVLLSHFVLYGMREGRQGSSEFDVEIYKENYPELTEKFGDNLKDYYMYYITTGKSLGQNAKTLLGTEPITVYNGVDYASVYDFQYYIDHYKEVKAKFGEDDLAALEYFVTVGMKEGHQAAENFNVQAYKNNYADLQAAFGDDLSAYYVHYINYGKAEGRKAEKNDVTPTIKPTATPTPTIKVTATPIPTAKPTVTPTIKVTATPTPTVKPTTIPTATPAVTIYDGVDYAAVYNYEYYLANNTDVKNVFGTDEEAVLAHFVNYGMKQGRQAAENFNVDAYKENYSDLRAVFGEDIKAYYLHYINYGKAEGRVAVKIVTPTPTVAPTVAPTVIPTVTPTPKVTVYGGIDYALVYDFDYYIGKYADLKNAYGNNPEAAIKHFVEYGMMEGRQASAAFNVQIYKDNYADLQAAYGNDTISYYMHYINYGHNENRNAMKNIHLTSFVHNGIDYSVVYDFNYYVNHYTDLKNAFGEDEFAAFDHFINYGMQEGRQASENFNVNIYRARYSDLRRIFGDNLPSYYVHYIQYGLKEGRIAR